VYCELFYPDGTNAFYVSNPAQTQDELAEVLEHGYALFGDSKYQFVLRNIYKTAMRRGEALLLGKSIAEMIVSPLAFRSTALPRTGAALLHDTSAALPLSVFMNTGFGSPDSKTALLSIELLSDQNAVSSFTAGADTAGYNTVLVDRKPHNGRIAEPTAPANAILLAFHEFGDGGTYASANASGQFGEKAAYPSDTPAFRFYQRLLYCVSPYVVDLFRVQGGQWHDYVYHGPGLIHSLPGESWTPFAGFTDEPGILKGAEAASQVSTQKGIYAFSFLPREAGQLSERLWFIDPVGSQRITGKSRSHSFIVARREMKENEGDLFAVVHEIHRGDPSPNFRVSRVDLEPATDPRGFQAVALAVEQGNDLDLFLSAIQPDVQYTANYRNGKIVFQGSFGHVRMKEGKFQTLQLVGGTKLRYDVHGVEMEKSLIVGAVNGVQSASGAVTVQFPYRFPTGNAELGNLLMVMAASPFPVMFQPLMIRQVEGEIADFGGPLQTVTMQNHPNLIDPPLSLAAPIRNGDQVLHETVAELTYRGGDDYSIFYSAPVTLMVDGAGENHRVVLQTGTLLRRIRGEAVAGTVSFHLDPLESVDGRVNFMRMP